MAIRYRRSAASAGTAYEGEVENLAELQALATLGTLTSADEVALDGSKFRPASQIAELKGSFRERPAPAGNVVGNIVMMAALGILGLVALGFVLKIAAVAVKLAVIAGIGLGAVWLVRKLLK